MEYIYGDAGDTKKSNDARIKADLDERARAIINPTKNNGGGLENLPTYLPNTRPLPSQSELPQKESTDQSRKVERIPTPTVVPIKGTDIVLETDEDVQEWIRQRKLNWMKKISDKREAKTSSSQPTGFSTTNPRSLPRDKRKHQVVKVQHQQTKRSHDNKTHNLNRMIIQRELEKENVEILDVIKELFTTGIIE